MSDALMAAVHEHPEAASLMHDLAGRGIFVQLDERGQVFHVETKGVPITVEQLRAFKTLRADLTAICEAGNIRRLPSEEAS